MHVKPIRETRSGLEFKSVVDAAKHFNLKYHVLKGSLKHGDGVVDGYKFVYIDRITTDVGKILDLVQQLELLIRTSWFFKGEVVKDTPVTYQAKMDIYAILQIYDKLGERLEVYRDSGEDKHT